MDPNSGKKGLFNKLSKEQGIYLLKHENFKRKTVSFYMYVILVTFILKCLLKEELKHCFRKIVLKK